MIAYAPKDLDRIVEIMARASGGLAIDRQADERGLVELIHAIGRAHDGSEEQQYFHALGADDPTASMLVKGFLAMAEADNPLTNSVCYGEFRARLNGIVRVRWTPRWRRDGRMQDPS